MKVIIAEDKLKLYLLKPNKRNDKSKFLNNLGFNQNNWGELKKAILDVFDKNSISSVEDNEYGKMFSIIGDLIGVNNKMLNVKTIWIQQNSSSEIRFVTLFPNR